MLVFSVFIILYTKISTSILHNNISPWLLILKSIKNLFKILFIKIIIKYPNKYCITNSFISFLSKLDGFNLSSLCLSLIHKKIVSKNTYINATQKIIINKFNVGNILPVIIIYKDDKEIKRIIGEKSEEELFKEVEDCYEENK